MNSWSDARTRKAHLHWLSLFSAMVLVGCGPSTSPISTEGATSGIEGTGIENIYAISAISSGPIERTDGISIQVNGESWSGANAQVKIDGLASSTAELLPGMIAIVRGDRLSEAAGDATSIDVRPVLRGEISSLNASSRHLVVMGQSVVGDQNTVIDVPGGTFDSLYVGQVVSVSGYLLAPSGVRATLISVPNELISDQRSAVGLVTTTDPSLQRLTIDGLTVSYEHADLTDAPAAFPRVGQLLTVTGHDFTGDGMLIAETVSGYDAGLLTDGNPIIVLSAIVHQIVSDVEFRVGWQRVLMSPETPVTNGPLTQGSMVRVTGTMTDEGTLAASSVSVLASIPRWWEIFGTVDAIEIDTPYARVMHILGVEIRFDISTPIIEHSSPSGDRVLAMTDIAVGDRVGVQVLENLSAIYIGRPGFVSEPRNVIAGDYFSSLSPPDRFTIYGFADFTIEVSADTEFTYADQPPTFDFICDTCRRVDSEEFWELAAMPRPNENSYVEVWVDYDGSTFFARHIWLYSGG